MMHWLPAPFVLAMAVAVPVAAQPPPEPVRTQSIGAGVQWGSPYSGAHVTPGVQVTWHRWIGPHVGVGADARWKSLKLRHEVAVPGMEQRDDEDRSAYGLGVSLLGRMSAGRLSLIGGAGPGLFVEHRAYESLLNGSRHTGSDTFRSIGLLALMEIDVRVTDRVSAFAGLRLEWRELSSAESSFGYPAAGVRVAF